MKANRTDRTRGGSLRDDRDGVSVVVGAVMLTGLLVATMMTVRLTYVPVWEKDKEAAFMQDVAADLGAFVGSLHRQTEAPNDLVLAHTLQMARGGATLFQAVAPPSDVEFQPGSAVARVASNRLNLIVDNQTSVAGANETWTNVGGSTVENISRMDSFRLKIATVSSSYQGDSVRVSVTDANGNYAGDLRVLVVSDPPDYNLNVRVRDRADTVLSQQDEAYHQSNAISPYWVDLLHPGFRFDKVLAAAAKPYSVTITESSASSPHISAEFAAAYLQRTAGGSDVATGGGGLPMDNYARTHAGGTLRVQTHARYHPEQTFVVEHGALVVSQHDGAAFRVKPAFRADVAGSRTVLTMAVPTLVGEALSGSARSPGSVYTNATRGTTFVAEAPRFEWNLTTEFPGLWASFWRTQLADAGLSEASGHYAVANGTGWARLTVYGATTAPASLVYDLTVTFHEARIGVDLRV